MGESVFQSARSKASSIDVIWQGSEHAGSLVAPSLNYAALQRLEKLAGTINTVEARVETMSVELPRLVSSMLAEEVDRLSKRYINNEILSNKVDVLQSLISEKFASLQSIGMDKALQRIDSLESQVAQKFADVEALIKEVVAKSPPTKEGSSSFHVSEDLVKDLVTGATYEFKEGAEAKRACESQSNSDIEANAGVAKETEPGLITPRNTKTHGYDFMGRVIPSPQHLDHIMRTPDWSESTSRHQSSAVEGSLRFEEMAYTPKPLESSPKKGGSKGLKAADGSLRERLSSTPQKLLLPADILETARHDPDRGDKAGVCHAGAVKQAVVIPPGRRLGQELNRRELSNLFADVSFDCCK